MRESSCVQCFVAGGSAGRSTFVDVDSYVSFVDEEWSGAPDCEPDDAALVAGGVVGAFGASSVAGGPGGSLGNDGGGGGGRFTSGGTSALAERATSPIATTARILARCME